MQYRGLVLRVLNVQCREDTEWMRGISNLSKWSTIDNRKSGQDFFIVIREFILALNIHANIYFKGKARTNCTQIGFPKRYLPTNETEYVLCVRKTFLDLSPRINWLNPSWRIKWIIFMLCKIWPPLRGSKIWAPFPGDDPVDCGETGGLVPIICNFSCIYRVSELRDAVI